MEVKDILEKIDALGQEHDFFVYTTIGELDKSCCSTSETTVIDFDKTKDFVCKKSDMNPISSSDALKIIANNHRLDFIEMKSFQKFIQWQLKEDVPIDDQLDKVNKQIEDFDLKSKIKGSLLILDNIAHSNKLNLTKKERHLLDNTEKNFIVLTDISVEENPLEFITETLDFLGQASSSIQNILKEELASINPSALHNFHQPKLKSCDDIDEFYK